ncbi:hypothetical protein ASPCAL01854 [Aspergillus calidoustus]|uniref:F-box domain-containing protein n=1 Tax=Aspergillus calidoustus TaxID=454130 RepID=A0A0U5HDR7_ASPCI|nr:hypothetical protein ASPCAL01854 [Aspergillus calidoustus]
MAGLSSLPDELIALIFENCLNDRTHNPSSWLLTSRRLYHIAISILYRHISVQLPNVPKLLQPADGMKSGFTDCTFHRTESITIHVPFAQSFDKPRAWSEVPPGNKHPDQYDAIHDIARPVRLSQNSVADILSTLPRTVTSLELSALVIQPPWDRYRRQGSSKICNELRKLIRQLHHLRLRVPGLCENQLSRFDDRTSGKPFPLRSAVFMLSMPRYQWDVRDSTARIENLRIRRFHSEDREKRRISLSADARALCTSGRFPHLNKFIVLDALDVNERTEIVVRVDAVAGDTAAYPIQLLDGQAGEGLLAGIPTFDMKYVIRVVQNDSPGDGTKCWKEYVGSYGELLCSLEGSAAWAELPNGRRVPIDIDGDQPRMDLHIQDADAFQTHSELSCHMLRDPEMSIRPGRIGHIPCSVDLQEVFEKDLSVGYEIAFRPDKVPNNGLQAVTG